MVHVRHVAIVPDKLLVALSWHPDAGGALEQLELSAPGIVDDRVIVH